MAEAQEQTLRLQVANARPQDAGQGIGRIVSAATVSAQALYRGTAPAMDDRDRG